MLRTAGWNGLLRSALATSPGGVGVGWARVPGRQVLAVLLATALLLCHGVFGASHALANHGVSSTDKAPAPHQTLHQEGATPGVLAGQDIEASKAPAAGGEQSAAVHTERAENYFAVLLVLTLATMLGLPRGAFSMPIRRADPQAPIVRRRFVGRPYFSCKLFPPLLQVFRL